MSIKELKFEIECGETTCASEPGKFCRFCNPGVQGGGICFFFGKIFDKDGWLQRHKECIEQTLNLAD